MAPGPPVRSQPLIAVVDVLRASLWYQRVLGATSGHGGEDYERLLVDDDLVLQLHRRDTADHHGLIADPASPVGNGVLLWFEVDAFDPAVARLREIGADVLTDVHRDPNSGRREIWVRDLDGYLVVLSEASS